MAGLLDTPTDYGLVSGLGQGLQMGMQAYNQERDRQFKVKQYQDTLDAQNLARQQQKENMEMQGAEHNLVRNPNAAPGESNWTPSPEGLLMKKYAMLKAAGEAAQYDPNNPQVKGLLGIAGVNAPEGTTLAGVKAVEPLLKYQETKLQTNQKKSDKDDENDAKIIKEYGEKRDNFRGDNAAQQANANLTAVRNAKAIINAYPDLNQMPQDQVNLLRTEMAKIAGGGSATAHGTSELGTPTFISGLQKVLSYGENDPKGAQLGSFLKNNVNYLNDLEKNNQEVVDPRHIRKFGGTLQAIKNQNKKQEFEEENPDDYALYLDSQKSNKEKMSNIKSGKGLVPAGLVNTQQQQAPPGTDPDAVKYSQMHNLPLDQAADIVAKRKAAMGNQ